jgi:hypothetical protein
VVVGPIRLEFFRRVRYALVDMAGQVSAKVVVPLRINV